MYVLIYSFWSVVILLVFGIIVYWTYNPKTKQRFDAAEQLPFADQMPDTNKRSNGDSL